MNLNKKQLQELAFKQQDLDNYIENGVNLTKFEIHEKRKIALFVEVGEFLNEVRAFKYWSQKPPSFKEVQLEEFIDGLHFMLSLGNYHHFDFLTFHYNDDSNEMNIDKAALKFIHNLSYYIKEDNLQTYSALLNSFLAMGNALNYTWLELIKAYEIKNKINYQRKDNNY